MWKSEFNWIRSNDLGSPVNSRRSSLTAMLSLLPNDGCCASPQGLPVFSRSVLVRVPSPASTTRSLRTLSSPPKLLARGRVLPLTAQNSSRCTYIWLICALDKLTRSDRFFVLYSFLDSKDATSLEYKLDSFSSVYRKLTGKDVVFEFPVQNE